MFGSVHMQLRFTISGLILRLILYLDVIITYFQLDMSFSVFSMFCFCSLMSAVATFKTGAIDGQVLDE